MRAMPTLIAAALLTSTATARAQPATQTASDPTAEARAKYTAAQAALDAGRYADALRDFQAAYAITGDPAVLYKLGRAHEGAGDCGQAITFFERYLNEAKPAPAFVALAEERIAACTGAPAKPRPAPPAPQPGAAGDLATAATPPPTSPEAAPEAAPDAAPDAGRHRGPWLLVGGSLALVTIGAVLAYSAEASENDLADLYVQAGGLPPDFDANTAAEYDTLRDEGRRYEVLSWMSFGAAAAVAAGAAIWWAVSDDPERLTVVPMATPDSAGATATLRF